MRAGAHEAVISAYRLYGPLIALFGGALLALREAGAGLGFLAGLAVALVLALHILVFGARAARAALPPLAMRALLGLGVCAALAGYGAPAWIYAAQLAEAGLFAATAAAASLILALLCGRAPTLRDEDW